MNSLPLLFSHRCPWPGRGWGAGLVLLIGLLGGVDAGRAAGYGDWKILFDGTSTDAFHAWDGDYFPSVGWKIDGDTLQCVPGAGRTPGERADIVTKDSFDDFELRWEWKIARRAESGLKYFLQERAPNSRALFVGDNGKEFLGHEYQLLDDERHPEARQLIGASASWKDVFPRSGADPNTAGGWNASRLVVQGNHVEHWLNDVKVLEYELGSERVKEALAQSKFKKVPGLGVKRKSPILLEDNSTAIWFRNMRVREWTAE